MSKKKKSGATPPREWGEWSEAFYPDPEVTRAKLGDKLTEEEWVNYMKWREGCKVFRNNLYQVAVTPVQQESGTWIWLSIKRIDRKVIHDWRHLQRIKNDLVGEEREAIEIYPPESQLVDEANQFHLWVMPAGVFSPVGFREGRRVGGAEEAEKVGAKQRNFD